MIEIKDTVVTLDLFREHFCCDLGACKGACCIEGDAGAPVKIEEVEQLEEAAEIVWDDLSPKAQAVIKEQERIIEEERKKAEEEAKRIINEAIKSGEAKKRETVFEAKEEIHKERTELEREIKERRSEMSKQERRLQQKEENLDKKTENLEQKELEAKQKAEKQEKIKEIFAEVIEDNDFITLRSSFLPCVIIHWPNSTIACKNL